MPETTLHTQLIEAIFTVSRLMKENMSFENQMTHLSLLQIQTLIFLKKNKNAQMQEIAQNFHITLPSATSLIDKLAKIELIERIKDEKDRRLVRIVLTKNGETLLHNAMKARSEKIEKLLSFLSEADKKELLRILKVINNNMESQK